MPVHDIPTPAARSARSMSHVEQFRFSKDQHLSGRYWSFSGASRSCDGRQLRPFLARNAIFHGLRILGIAAPQRVLVPSYICRAAIEPIAALEVGIDFYRIQRDGSADVGDIAAKITPETKALLVVHYFGFPQDMGPLVMLCRQYGLSIIEDCAHVLEGHAGGQALGSFGDISVFSWRKFLPTYDGAALVVNRPGVDASISWEPEPWLFTAKVAKNLLDDALGCSLTDSLAPLIRWLRRRVEHGSEAGVPATAVSCRSEDFQTRLVHWPMSRLSRWIQRHADIPAIVDCRRRNYRYMQSRLQTIPGVRLFHDRLPDCVCPWVLPFFCDGLTGAHLTLRRQGIPAVTWGGVRPSSLPSGRFLDAEFLYDKLVFLPVHQNLKIEHMDLMVDCIARLA